MPTNDEIMAMIAAQKYAQMRQNLLSRNMNYAVSDWQSKMTTLTPDQEKAFLAWVAENKVKFNPKDPYPDYDLRGFYKALMNKDPRAVSKIDPNDKELHYNDYWKTPYHESFSNESQYATEGAPKWQDKKLMSSTGEVIFDDTVQRKN
jgi:hypothetical protein